MTRPSAFHALAHPARRQILDLLRQRPHRAGEIAARFPAVSRPAISKHLRILRRSRLVDARRRGRERIYRLDARPLRQVERWLRQYAEHWDRQLGAFQAFLTSDEED